MSNNDLKTKLEDHIGYVSINRPPNNHFDAELIGQIADFLEEMDNERECRGIILSSEGKHFCAGADFTRSSYKDESFNKVLQMKEENDTLGELDFDLRFKIKT